MSLFEIDMFADDTTLLYSHLEIVLKYVINKTLGKISNF